MHALQLQLKGQGTLQAQIDTQSRQLDSLNQERDAVRQESQALKEALQTLSHGSPRAHVLLHDREHLLIHHQETLWGLKLQDEEGSALEVGNNVLPLKTGFFFLVPELLIPYDRFQRQSVAQWHHNATTADTGNRA